MIRQILVALFVVVGLSACGVGADEDYATLVQAIDQTAAVASADQVPQGVLNPVLVAVDPSGINGVVAVGSTAPTNPGDTNSSSQDPIPPKIQPTRTQRVSAR